MPNTRETQTEDQNQEQQAIDTTGMLTPAAVCQRYKNKVSVKTLSNWRSRKAGPAYIKVGAAVFYKPEDLEKWEKENTYLKYKTTT